LAALQPGARIPVRLSSLWRVDATEPNAKLFLVVSQHVDRITVNHLDDFACELIGWLIGCDSLRFSFRRLLQTDSCLRDGLRLATSRQEQQDECDCVFHDSSSLRRASANAADTSPAGTATIPNPASGITKVNNLPPTMTK
jgi:hypothetical protein